MQKKKKAKRDVLWNSAKYFRKDLSQIKLV